MRLRTSPTTEPLAPFVISGLVAIIAHRHVLHLREILAFPTVPEATSTTRKNVIVTNVKMLRCSLNRGASFTG